MLKSNKLNFIIALVAAIVLWVYVLSDDTNVLTTETVRNVPITLLNEETLTDHDLVVLDTDLETVNITFSGQRSDVNKVKAKSFKVFADLEGLTAGENVLRLTIEKPDEVTIDKVTNNYKFTVTVDNLISVDRNVVPIIVNQFNDESEPSIVQVGQATVKVTGAESLVDQVARVAAYVDAGKVSNQLKALTIGMTPINTKGEPVEGVELSRPNVSVTAVMLNKKTVPLEVAVTGAEHETLHRTYSVPKTVTVKGPDYLLDTITQISCEPVDLTEVYEDIELKLTPLLPEGVTLATNSAQLALTVSVDGVETRSFTVNESSIAFEGVTETMIPELAEVPLAIEIIATGKSSIMSDLTAEDFSVTANVADLGAGTHTVSLVCVCAKELVDLEFSPQQINIVMTENELIEE